ncbi:MAG: nucleotidyl transferase AbiEii/AbiGii toxin family protein [Steroidobacteraceae bacterium]
MYPDFKELLSEFNAHRVKYLIVGGYAVSFHAQPRATKDLDILVRADPENGKAVYAALAKFGAPVEGLSPQDLTEPGSFYRMGAPPVMVDILPSIRGVEFDLAWSRRVDAVVDDTLTVPIISREDLLASKIAAGRAQDLADVAALNELQSPHEHQAQESNQPHLDPSRSIDELQQQSAARWASRANRSGYSRDEPENEEKLSSEHDQTPERDPDL